MLVIISQGEANPSRNKQKVIKTLLKKTITKIKSYLIIMLAISILSGCNLFRFSPYDDDLQTDVRNSNKKNISKILTILSETSTDSFAFALISDSHSDYDDLHDVVKWINNNKNIKFTLFLGDQTDFGLKFEFENTLKELKELNIPFITIIGNHDYLSQGKSLFEKLYGETNFTFSAGSNKFICFDNIVWENNNKKPDFEWLRNELNYHSGNIFLLSHIPEESEPMSDYRLEYNSLIEDIPNLYRFHGHTHRFRDEWPKLTTCEITKKIIPVIYVQGSAVYYSIEECE